MHTFNPESRPHFFFETPNPGLEIKKIPHPEKPIRNTQNGIAQFFYSAFAKLFCNLVRRGYIFYHSQHSCLSSIQALFFLFRKWSVSVTAQYRVVNSKRAFSLRDTIPRSRVVRFPNTLETPRNEAEVPFHSASMCHF